MSFTLKDSIGPAGLTKGRAEAALAGQTLANRYDVLELLGTGGMGAVYRARDRELDDIVALKVIRKELAAEPAMVERFRHEVKLARRVTHVNVARTFELGTVDGLMYCTMELVDGQALSARLQQRSKLQVGEAVAIACAVCDGLAAAHAANVIHRDIKPDNILLASDGRVVLADFGVAAAGVGAAGELSGTPAYMAPEQARGESPRPAADVYAVGVVLAEMLSGRCPFSGDALAILDDKQQLERVVLTEVPPELAVVVGQATARDVDTRIQSAAALHRALEPWARGMTRMPTQPQRVAAVDASELRTVVLVAPVGQHERLYLAEAVHEQLLARLVRTPRLRVLPRAVDGGLPGAIAVTYGVGDALTVNVALPDGAAFMLQFPLTFAHVAIAADAILEAIEGEVGRDGDQDDARNKAIELFLRARHEVQRDITKMPQVLELLREARELAPAEPRVLACSAICFVRTAFFLPAFMPDALDRARQLAYAAIVAAPDLADGHIAVGHVELGFGNGVLAATHFRTAIRCAPHLAEAHEQLGRLLVEAGYIDAAVARLEEAISIAPELRSARWEIVRAYALEGKWHELETVASALVQAAGVDRPLARSRYAWWRRDFAELERLRTRSAGALDLALHAGLLDALFGVFLDENGWRDRRDQLLAIAALEHPNRRRVTFILQLIIEAAAFAQDRDTAFSLLYRATDRGLFDRHWLERCPTLESLRDDPRYPAVHAQIRERADAIHDALHGDNAALSETAIA